VLRVLGIGFRVCIVWGSGSSVQGSGFRLSVFGFVFGVSGFGFRVSGLEFWASGFGFSGYGFRVSGFSSGFRFMEDLMSLWLMRSPGNKAKHASTPASSRNLVQALGVRSPRMSERWPRISWREPGMSGREPMMSERGPRTCLERGVGWLG